MAEFHALPGIYEYIFLHFEPWSEIFPFVTSVLYGPEWFYNELVPTNGPPPVNLDPRAVMATWQLCICYVLLFLMTSFGFRAVRDVLSHNPAGQELIMGIFFGSLCAADITHLFLTFRTLPPAIAYRPWQWNPTTHGNLTVVFLLHVSRISWFLGIGRKRYYFGQPKAVKDKAYKKD